MTDQRRNVYFFHKQDQETHEQANSLTQLAEEHGFTVVNQPQTPTSLLALAGTAHFCRQSERRISVTTACTSALPKRGKLIYIATFIVMSVKKWSTR